MVLNGKVLEYVADKENAMFKYTLHWAGKHVEPFLAKAEERTERWSD